MGKKKLQGAALRAKKRAQQANELLQEQQAEQAASSALQGQQDAHLFVLDKTGDTTTAVFKTAVARGEFRAATKKQRHGLSELDQQKVDRLRRLHDDKTLHKLAQKGRELLLEQRKGGSKKRVLRGSSKATFDLWKNEEEEEQELPVNKKRKQTTSKPSLVGLALAGVAPAHVPVKAQPFHKQSSSSEVVVVKVDVAKTGQSYHPDPIAHAKLLQATVAVELERNTALEKLATPLAKGLTDETRRIMVGDDDTDEESEQEEEEQEEDPSNPGLLRAAKKRDMNKLTRAQRNKKKRLRQEQAAMEKRKQEKRFLNQVSEIPRYAKELEQQASMSLQRKEHIAQLKVTSKRILGKNVEQHAATCNPITAPTLAVALPSELKTTTTTSLRSLKPKGCLVHDRIHSLVDRSLAIARDTQAPKPKKRRLKVQGGVIIEGPDGFEIKG